MIWGGALIKAWSKTLPTIALSTGEAELGAVVRGTAEAEGIASILDDFGVAAETVLKSDATAALGIVQRMGLGKVRHLAVADLWVQQRVRRGEISVQKTPGDTNPSDLMTKPLDRSRIEKLAKIIGMVEPESRDEGRIQNPAKEDTFEVQRGRGQTAQTSGENDCGDFMTIRAGAPWQLRGSTSRMSRISSTSEYARTGGGAGVA